MYYAQGSDTTVKAGASIVETGYRPASLSPGAGLSKGRVVSALRWDDDVLADTTPVHVLAGYSQSLRERPECNRQYKTGHIHQALDHSESTLPWGIRRFIERTSPLSRITGRSGRNLVAAAPLSFSLREIDARKIRCRLRERNRLLPLGSYTKLASFPVGTPRTDRCDNEPLPIAAYWKGESTRSKCCEVS